MSGTPAGWLDAHCHLGWGEERDDAVVRAEDAGVRRVIVCGTSDGDWPTLADLAARRPLVRACYGHHPWRITQRPRDWLDRLRKHLLADALAVGEIGLDRSLTNYVFQEQLQEFRRQLDLAAELQLPAVVHCVRAFGALLDVLRARRPDSPGVLLHAYAGPPDLIPELATLGCWFSFAGNLLHEGHQRGKASWAAVPSDRLMVETDAPHLLPPEPFAPHVTTLVGTLKCNEPANLPSLAAGLAELRGLEVEELRRQNWANALALFGPRLL